MTERLGDRYALGEVIGTGGGSTVRLGVDELLDRTVAVKMISDAAASTADPAGRERFLHEARSLARFDHPHVVRIFDAGETDGTLYMVMEYVEGTTLAHLIAHEAPIPTAAAVEIIDQVLEGLSAVHADGFVHRDIKPANVLIDRSRHVSLTDFGIAKRLDDIEQSLTAVGMVVGTPAYLPPEQAAGGDVGPWTDIYAVGLLLAELVDRESTPLSSVIDRATRDDPAERFQNAAEMAQALRVAARTETAMMPVTAVPLEHTQVMAAAGPQRDSDATSVMVPAASISESRTVRRGIGARPGWLVPAVVIGAICLVLTVGALSSRDDSMFENLPTRPATIPVTIASTPVVVPAPTVPAVTDSAPPQANQGGQGGSGGQPGGNGGGNDDGKPDKPEKPEKPENP